MKLLLGILQQKKPESLIVFCNTKKYAEIVAKRLKINGYTCEFIIGDLPQVKRLKIIDDVKAGKIKTLVATDVAARGLDIESLAMVINYDLPVEAENYVHRIGRTARAGKTGIAITLASEQDVYELPAVERYIGKKIPSEIAMPELYAEDKSAGKYIQTEFYEERHHPAVSHGAPKGAGRRGETKKSDSRRKPPRPVPAPAGHHKQEPRKKQERETPPPNIAQLSMEERMAHYKKKYSSGEAKHGAHKEHGNREKQHHVTKHKAPHHKHQGEHTEHVAQAAQTEQIKQSTPEKKGIISKLRGLFKKK
jgi:ATP-dependent RNA helicase RhlB